jgi:hypothetical protein
MNSHFEAKFAVRALLVALCVVPPAFGQAQTAPPQNQSAAPSQSSAQSPAQSQAPAQSPAQSTGPAATSTVPQMQSQEAPPPDSLGEAARKARAQKSRSAAPKVYTEDKIAGLSGHGVSVVGDGTVGGSGSEDSSNSYAAPAANEAGGATPGGKNEEQIWREKARRIHDAMSQIDDQIAKIQDEIRKYGAVSFDPARGLQQNIIYIEDRNAQIKQLEAQKEKLQAQLEALEDEGRKAGADSGWFR